MTLPKFRVRYFKHAPILILVVVGFFTYVNSFHNQFLCVDDYFISQNLLIKSLKYTPQIFTSNTIAGAGQISDYYRPLTSLSFAVDHAIWGWNVVGFHLTNTLLHIGVGVMV